MASALVRPSVARTGRSAYRERHPAPASAQPSVLTREPWSSLYVAWRGLTSFLLLPVWTLYYALLSRPRPSWSLTQAVQVAWLRYVAVLPERTGRSFYTRDPQATPGPDELRETEFVWALPLRTEDRAGVLLDDEVDFQDRVGVFIWPKAGSGERRVLDKEGSGLVGLFFHGGALVHMNAGERLDSARIPRRLVQDGVFDCIFSVEYRLIRHTAFPGFLQDAASVYAHLVLDLAVPPARVVLIGDSAGGNVALGLCRWLRDAAPVISRSLGMPAGLLLLSPWCDPSNSFPFERAAHVPRPHADTDYLLDDPAPRALLVSTLLGHHPQSLVRSPYVSPASRQLAGDRNLFADFPPTFLHYGGAERLELEAATLADGLRLSDVPLTVVYSPDAVHDILILGRWDEREREAVWRAVGEWTCALREGALGPDGEGVLG